MRYLLFWDISSADPGMLILSQKIIRLSEDPMERDRENAKMHHFPILVWRGGGINFPSISYKQRRKPGGILNINHSRLRDEIPAPGSSVPRTLVKAKPR